MRAARIPGNVLGDSPLRFHTAIRSIMQHLLSPNRTDRRNCIRNLNSLISYSSARPPYRPCEHQSPAPAAPPPLSSGWRSRVGTRAGVAVGVGTAPGISVRAMSGPMSGSVPMPMPTSGAPNPPSPLSPAVWACGVYPTPRCGKWGLELMATRPTPELPQSQSIGPAFEANGPSLHKRPSHFLPGR